MTLSRLAFLFTAALALHAHGNTVLFECIFPNQTKLYGLRVVQNPETNKIKGKIIGLSKENEPGTHTVIFGPPAYRDEAAYTISRQIGVQWVYVHHVEVFTIQHRGDEWGDAVGVAYYNVVKQLVDKGVYHRMIGYTRCN